MKNSVKRGGMRRSQVAAAETRVAWRSTVNTLGGYRPAVEITLCLITALGGQKIARRSGPYPFRDTHQAQTVP